MCAPPIINDPLVFLSFKGFCRNEVKETEFNENRLVFYGAGLSKFRCNSEEKPLIKRNR